MSKIPYAPGARLIELTMVPSVPGQIQHNIPSTGITKIFNRGHGLWSGVARFGVLKGNAAAQVEAMFASLNGSENYVELPLRGRRTIATSTHIVTSIGSVFTLSDIPDGLGRGAYVRSGDRVFIISAQPSSDSIQLWPSLLLQAGDSIEPALTIQARSSDGVVPELPSTPHWSGPWVFGFSEVV